jgi:hypothetical protein
MVQDIQPTTVNVKLKEKQMSFLKNSNSDYNQPEPQGSITATRSQLAAAFNSWLKDAETNPDNFLTGPYTETYGDDCADYLINALKAV